MKDYKRLTEEHISDAEFCSGCSFDDDLNGCEMGGCDKYYVYFETYEKLRTLEDKIESGELCEREEVRKETAREILKTLYKKTHNYYPSIDSYCVSKKVILVKDLEEACREYGIDLEDEE